MYENTLLVVQSDNGGPTFTGSDHTANNYPLKGSKVTNWYIYIALCIYMYTSMLPTGAIIDMYLYTCASLAQHERGVFIREIMTPLFMRVGWWRPLEDSMKTRGRPTLMKRGVMFSLMKTPISPCVINSSTADLNIIYNNIYIIYIYICLHHWTCNHLTILQSSVFRYMLFSDVFHLEVLHTFLILWIEIIFKDV